MNNEIYDFSGCAHKWIDDGVYKDDGNTPTYTYQKCSICGATRTLDINGDCVQGSFILMDDILFLRDLMEKDIEPLMESGDMR
jgi:hypothetical protein